MSGDWEWCGVLLRGCAIKGVVGLEDARAVIGCRKRNHVRNNGLSRGRLDLVNLDRIGLWRFAIALVVNRKVRDGVFTFGGKAQLNRIAFDHCIGTAINGVVQLNHTGSAIVVGRTQGVWVAAVVGAVVSASARE